MLLHRCDARLLLFALDVEFLDRGLNSRLGIGCLDNPIENAWIDQRMIDPDIDHATVASGYGAWAAGPIHDPAELAGVFREAVAQVEQGNVAVVSVRTAGVTRNRCVPRVARRTRIDAGGVSRPVRPN